MFSTIYSKLKGVEYKGKDSLRELDRILVLVNVIVTDRYTNSDPQVHSREFLLNELDKIRIKEITWQPVKEINEETFDSRKADALVIMEGLNKFMQIGEISMREIFVGEKTARQEDEVGIALLGVEQDYIEYFKSRPPIFQQDKHDRLHNHWMSNSDKNHINFGFPPDCVLPIEIQEKAIEAVKAVTQNI